MRVSVIVFLLINIPIVAVNALDKGDELEVPIRPDSTILRRQAAVALDSLFKVRGVSMSSQCRGEDSRTLALITPTPLTREMAEKTFASMKAAVTEAGFYEIVFESATGQRTVFRVQSPTPEQPTSQENMVLSSPEESRLGNTWLKCFKAHVALFKPLETGSETAKAYATAPLGIPNVQTISIQENGEAGDTISVTTEFIGQENYIGVSMDPTGEVRLRVTLENYTDAKLRILWSESNVVDNDGIQYEITSPASTTLRSIRPGARSTMDVSCLIRDRFGTNLGLCTGFTLYLETKIGDREVTIQQRFDRIPWSYRELDNLAE